MCWGFAVDEGWYNIICDLSYELEDMIVTWKKRHPFARTWPRAAQVKEKNGGLRFYMEKPTQEMTAAIAKAYAKADKTCEKCGKRGKIRDESYMQTLCDDCFAERSLVPS